MPLNHVALTVADRERSAAFYAEHFGLTRLLHDEAQMVILGDEHGSVLTLTEGDPPVAELPPENHIGFQLGSRDEVRAARERLRAAGVTEAEWQDDGVVTRVQVSDPDGYRVEYYGW
jgi:catechol 2,3-dioxygenase-like lactoylglutathione lyase family enzyme